MAQISQPKMMDRPRSVDHDQTAWRSDRRPEQYTGEGWNGRKHLATTDCSAGVPSCHSHDLPVRRNQEERQTGGREQPGGGRICSRGGEGEQISRCEHHHTKVRGETPLALRRADGRRREGRKWLGVGALALLLMMISHTQAHKKYPDVEFVYKQLDEFSTPEELEQQVPASPRRLLTRATSFSS